MIIDELLEKAFCEGYEYAQREFSDKKKKTKKKIGTALLLTGGAGILGGSGVAAGARIAHDILSIKHAKDTTDYLNDFSKLEEKEARGFKKVDDVKEKIIKQAKKGRSGTDPILNNDINKIRYVSDLYKNKIIENINEEKEALNKKFLNKKEALTKKINKASKVHKYGTRAALASLALSGIGSLLDPAPNYKRKKSSKKSKNKEK